MTLRPAFARLGDGRIPLALVNPWIASALYVLVALWWLIPGRRIERVLKEE